MKKSIITDALEWLGKIIPDHILVKRDAIHLAVEPMVAQQELLPGQIYYVDDKKVGIVDPFLENAVSIGQKFLLVLFPGEVSVLRHDWEHPLLPKNKEDTEILDQKEISILWMKRFAIENGYYEEDMDDYTHIIEKICEFLDGEIDCIVNGEWDITDTFWYHFEIITGRKIKDDDRIYNFPCTC